MSTTPICRCRVLYLGSSVPHVTKDGLQGIQEPLKELYPDQGTLNAKGIDSWLSVWSNGILLENVDESLRQVTRFFPIETLHYCAAVRYVIVPGTGGEKSTATAEKFLPLDSPFAHKTDPNHPPLFACILRRTEGIKVLECHSFICKKEAAANALVRCCFHAYADNMYARQLEDNSNYTLSTRKAKSLSGLNALEKITSWRTTTNGDPHHQHRNKSPHRYDSNGKCSDGASVTSSTMTRTDEDNYKVWTGPSGPTERDLVYVDATGTLRSMYSTTTNGRSSHKPPRQMVLPPSRPPPPSSSASIHGTVKERSKSKLFGRSHKSSSNNHNNHKNNKKNDFRNEFLPPLAPQIPHGPPPPHLYHHYHPPPLPPPPPPQPPQHFINGSRSRSVASDYYPHHHNGGGGGGLVVAPPLFHTTERRGRKPPVVIPTDEISYSETLHHQHLQHHLHQQQQQQQPAPPESHYSTSSRTEKKKRDKNNSLGGDSPFNTGIYKKKGHLNERAFSYSIRQEHRSRSNSLANLQFFDNTNGLDSLDDKKECELAQMVSGLDLNTSIPSTISDSNFSRKKQPHHHKR